MSDKLSLEQRAKRLAEYIESISGDQPAEEFMQVVDDDPALEALSKREVRKSTDAVERALQGSKLSAQDLFHAEAIVHKTKRPSHKIEDSKFDPFSGEFRYLTKNSGVRKNIQRTFSAIGRIDLPDRSTYGGTGFVVGKNLVMTNRHVAELFTRGAGRRNVSIRLRNSEIDFREEPDSDADGFRLTKCVMVHPYWDMALFTADLPDVDPLELSVATYQELLGDKQDVVVIGYPARDPRNARDVQRDIFGTDFQIKRIAPGRISKKKQAIGSEWLSTAVDALAHDASTLGGNSGSAIVNVDTGQVAALHFAGRYLIENYGVPCYELARDPRVVDAGVNFDDEADLPSNNTALDRYWREADDNGTQREKRPKPHVVDYGRRRTQGNSQSTSISTSSGAVTMEVPLRITLSLGDAQTGGTVVKADGSTDQGDSAQTESTGSGYDADFLSESVPAPQLDAEAADDAFEVNGSHLIPYTHFSVCQSKSRTLPRFVAWNIDGGQLKRVSRGNNFRRDRRVPDEFQADNALYRNNPYDRGHVARRADLNWGSLREAKRANSDSFFYTNITPQHEKFNQSSRAGLWGELENAIFDDVEVEDLKISVMGGPIFRDDDPEHRGVQIPGDFWKLIAFRDTADGQFKVSAYILSQKEFVPTEVLELDAFHLYHTSLSKLSEETELNFDDLLSFDTFSANNELVSGSGVREVMGRGDIVV